MPTLVLLAPDRADTPEATEALANTRWSADQTLRFLEGEPAWRVEPLLDQRATRTELEGAMARVMDRDRDAYVFLGHGRRDANPTFSKDALLGQGNEPVLDRDNIDRLEAEWVHAMACRSSVAIGPLAIRARVSYFAGYQSAVIMEWSPDEIPPAIRASLVELVVSTTRLLVDGCRDERELQRAARHHADAILEWYDEDPGADAHWVLFAEQLARVRLLDRS